MSSSVYNASFIAVVQSRIGSELLGRVMSLYYSMALLPSAIGLAATGFLADRIGLTNAFVGAGAVICLLGTIGFLSPAIRRLDPPRRSV